MREPFCHLGGAPLRRDRRTGARGRVARSRVQSRGLFDLVEVWVENAYLVEVPDPTQMGDYRKAMTVENWKRAFGV